MNALEVVKKAYEAWESKSAQGLREILHKDYKAVMPGGVEIVGIEQAEKCIDCPYVSHPENVQYIVDGNKVMRIWDMVHTEPKQFTVRLAELSVVEGDKVLFNEAFWDTNSFPQEMQEEFKKEQEKQLAAAKK